MGTGRRASLPPRCTPLPRLHLLAPAVVTACPGVHGGLITSQLVTSLAKGQGFPKVTSLTQTQVWSHGTPVTFSPGLLPLLLHLANSKGCGSRVPGMGAQAEHTLVPVSQDHRRRLLSSSRDLALGGRRPGAVLTQWGVCLHPVGRAALGPRQAHPHPGTSCPRIVPSPRSASILNCF